MLCSDRIKLTWSTPIEPLILTVCSSYRTEWDFFPCTLDTQKQSERKLYPHSIQVCPNRATFSLGRWSLQLYLGSACCRSYVAPYSILAKRKVVGPLDQWRTNSCWQNEHWALSNKEYSNTMHFERQVYGTEWTQDVDVCSLQSAYTAATNEEKTK